MNFGFHPGGSIYGLKRPVVFYGGNSQRARESVFVFVFEREREIERESERVCVNRN